MIDLSCLINNAPWSYYWHVCHYTNPPHAEPMKWMARCCHSRVAYLCHLRGGICPSWDDENILTDLDDFRRVISLPAMSLGDRICANRKGETGEVGEFTQRWNKHNLSSRMPLVCTGRAISLFFCMNQLKRSSHLVGSPFLPMKLDRDLWLRAMTIKMPLMSNAARVLNVQRIVRKPRTRCV